MSEDLTVKTTENQTSDEAKILRDLKKRCISLHQGDQTFIILGSDIDPETGEYVFNYPM